MRTKNQETLDRILKFVNKYYQEHHSSPTINDVAEGVGVARSTTHRYLQELSDRNLIDYDRGILVCLPERQNENGLCIRPVSRFYSLRQSGG